MFTNKNAIFEFKSLTEREQITQSSGWSNRYIFSKLLTYRARLVDQKFRKRESLNYTLYQTTPCIQLIEVPKSECICDIGDNCTILRSKYIIPKSIIPIKQVTNTTNNKQYSLTDINLVKYRTNTPFSSLNSKTLYYLQDTGKGDYLYIITQNPLLEKIVLTSIFENPLEVQTYIDCEGNIPFPKLSYYDYEFKLDRAGFTTILEMMFQLDFKLKLSAVQDKVNDSQFTTDSR